jgi:hypothetical protein
MPNPPKFLRSHLSPEGKVLITSWKHPGREWGLKLSGLDLPEGKQKAALWHAVEIVQDEGDARFEFKETGGQEELVVKQAVVVDDKEELWSGWMICNWKYDHPQLFWTTTKGGAAEKLPPFCERVLLVKQRLTEADIETQMKN